MKCDDKKLYNFTICTQIFTLHIGFDGLRHICRTIDRVADGYDVPAAVPQALRDSACMGIRINSLPNQIQERKNGEDGIRAGVKHGPSKRR